MAVTEDRHEPAATATAPGSWPNAPTHPVCQCTHGAGLHAIRTNRTRGACSVSTGPKAKPCPCTTFKEVTP